MTVIIFIFRKKAFPMTISTRISLKKLHLLTLIKLLNMIKKITNLVLLLVAMYPLASFAQDFDSPKKSQQIGASINFTHFPTTNFANGGTSDPGYSLFFWNGITNKVDYSVRYNGLFSHYTKNPNGKDEYINELEASLHARLMNDNHLIQPFATVGLGLGNYSQSAVPYFPLGLGIQMNLYSEGYIFLQSNYRVSTSSSKLDNNWFYSVGYTVPLTHRTVKAKVVPPPPPPAPVVVKDRDGDGVPDSLDECPDVKGLAQFHGCPDTDGDGIADKDDKCPTVAGVAKYQGCPIPDTDGDGVNDEEDQCPTVAGTAANHGCPEVKAEPKPEVKPQAPAPIEPSTETVYFTPSSNKLIKDDSKTLDNVVKILNTDAKLSIEVTGHSDNTGNAKLNQSLSDKRASIVVNYLTKKGIAATRITAKGLSDSQPHGDNKTEEGRSLNRRTEIKFKY